MDDDLIQQLKTLRPRARRFGIAIRKQRSTRGSSQALYRLLDLESGAVIRSDVALVDVSVELFWIIRERRRVAQGLVVGPSIDPCPSCGSQRIGYFGYCRTCGFDFEADRIPTPQLDTRTDDVLWLHEPWLLTPPEDSEQPAFPRDQASSSAPVPMTVDAPAQRRARLRSRFASPPEVAVGIVVGVLLGMIATIVGARS